MVRRKTHRSRRSAADDPRALRSRAALHNAMLRLIDSKPLDQITVREIATTAGISYVTFFRHHESKESLLQAIAAEEVKRLAELMLPALEASDTLAASTALCVYVDYHRKLWSTLLTGGAAAVLREEFLKNAAKVAASRSDPDNWLPPALAVSLNVSSTIEVLTWWLRQRRPVSIQRVAEIHERMVIRPIIEVDQSGKWKVGVRPRSRAAVTRHLRNTVLHSRLRVAAAKPIYL